MAKVEKAEEMGKVEHASEQAGDKAKEHAQPEFAIQRVYTKDISFESPNSPQVFQQEWKPDLKLDLQSTTTQLGDDTFEVVLVITATVNSNDKLAFLAEVKEAGIFVVRNVNQDQIGPIVGSLCPSIIFPYAREVISNLVIRGGFPQLNLAPINFDALYAQRMQQEAEKGKAQ